MSTYVMRTTSGATYILDLDASRMTRLVGRERSIGLPDLAAQSFDLHTWQVSGGRLEAWVTRADGRSGSITTTTLAAIVCPDGVVITDPQTYAAQPVAIGA